jgi:ferredoxin
MVNGAACDGHGICALVMPERISLDTWGYASVDPEALDDARLLALARRVVRACPAQALTILGDTPTPRRIRRRRDPQLDGNA